MVNVMPYFVKYYRAFFYDFNASFMLLQRKKREIKKPTSPIGEAGFRSIGCLK